SNVASNVQPFLSEISLGKAAIAHNGNLINVNPLREQLVKDGAIFASTSDTEIILHLLARAPQRGPQGSVITEALIDALSKVKGAFSLVLLFQDRLVAVRDPHGVRPLSIAKMNGAFIVASETCAFDLIGAEFVRDVEPGELVEFFNEKDGKVQQRSLSPFGMARPAPCVFEYVYFARPDSNIFGRNVYLVRKRLGQELAKEHPVKADIVVPVPDSGVTAAIGYSEASGIPLELGLIRNHYIGRTFIEPKQAIRDFGVKIKHNANPAILKGKSVVVVDDSIVRGTTSQKLVKMLRQAGARELHMRISSPPTIDPCFYGIDTPKKDELIAPKMSIEKIKEFLGVDSLAYLSRDGMYRAVAVSGEEPSALQQRFCDACFSGHYPIGTPADHKRKQQEIL
ncbi:MAG: amidophosphoribosyltransferase, partial [Proteobacteria bacterium]